MSVAPPLAFWPPDADPADLSADQMRVVACPICNALIGAPCTYQYISVPGTIMPTHHISRIRRARHWLRLDSPPGDPTHALR